MKFTNGMEVKAAKYTFQSNGNGKDVEVIVTAENIDDLREFFRDVDVEFYGGKCGTLKLYAVENRRPE